MPLPNTPDRCPTALAPDETLVAVIEMSQSSWLVAGIIPGVDRLPLKRLTPDPFALIGLLERWRDEATKAGKAINRMTIAYEAGRDGFWLARWLRARDIEAYVIHPTSIAVSREHRRAKTDRLDTELLKRSFSGWLRGERGHCSMAAIPTLDEEDAKRAHRERANLVADRTRIINRLKSCLIRFGIRDFSPTQKRARDKVADLRTPEGHCLPPHTQSEMVRNMDRLSFVTMQIKTIEKTRAIRITHTDAPAQAMVRTLTQINGLGVETADMLVSEIFFRDLRDRRAIARYAGLTGSPDESGSMRREKGLAKAGNARVRRGMIELAWRFLRFQGDSDLAKWFHARTEAAPARRKTMVVALARKLLISLWRMLQTGEIPAGVVLKATV
jgi:transposase